MSKVANVPGNSHASSLCVTKAVSRAAHTRMASRKAASSDWNL